MKKKVPKAKSRFSAAKKNMDIMRLLVSHKEFQKDVENARECLRIIPGGFKEDSQIEKWTDELYRRSDEIIDSPEFKRKLKTIRDNFTNGTLGHRMAQKQSRMVHFDIPVNYNTYHPQFLAETYNLPEHFAESIRRYILTGHISAPLNNFTGGEWPAWTSPKEVRYIPIKIYAQLTDDELQDLKREIELMGRHLPRLKPVKNLEQKITLEQWFTERTRLDEVAGREYVMSASEISKNVLGTTKKKKKVYEAARELKKMRTKRFGK